MKAVLRGILSRLFYWGDESVAILGKFASANLIALLFEWLFVEWRKAYFFRLRNLVFCDILSLC